MVIRTITVVFTLLFFLFFGCSSDVEKNHNISDIKNLIHDLSQDFENADISSFVNRGTDDMSFFSLDGHNLNKEKTVNLLQPMFSRWENRKMEIDSLQIFVDKNISWARYKSMFSFSTSRGETNMKNINTAIFKRDKSGNWKLHHFHMSTNQF
jgi:ketosteroid isomerase-like protein